MDQYAYDAAYELLSSYISTHQISRDLSRELVKTSDLGSEIQTIIIAFLSEYIDEDNLLNVASIRIRGKISGVNNAFSRSKKKRFELCNVRIIEPALKTTLTYYGLKETLSSKELARLYRIVSEKSKEWQIYNTSFETCVAYAIFNKASDQEMSIKPNFKQFLLSINSNLSPISVGFILSTINFLVDCVVFFLEQSKQKDFSSAKLPKARSTPQKMIQFKKKIKSTDEYSVIAKKPVSMTPTAKLLLSILEQEPSIEEKFWEQSLQD